MTDQLRASASSSPALPPDVRMAQQVAHVLDERGAAGWVGMLLPGIGDVLCGVVGLSIVGVAASRRLPRVTLARMCLNLALMVGIGTLPLLGDAFVFWFRGNSRNARLLARGQASRRGHWTDVFVLVLAGLALVAALVLPVVGVVWGVRRYLASGGL